MLSIAERHKYIIDTLNAKGFVKVSDIANAFNITTVTARKDLKQLEEKGLLYRTHGSASPANPHIGDRTVTEKENISISQLGGTYRNRSMSVIGSYTLSLLEKVTCSKSFLGMDAEFGVTTSNLEEAELNIAMMGASLKTIVLCDFSKFGRKGFGKICNLDKIDIIVTDSGISESMKEALEEQGIELIIA